MYTRIQAFKPYEKTNLIACEKNDPSATKYSLSYEGMLYPSATLDFTSLPQAEATERALHRVFKAGAEEKLRELRSFIGVSV